MTTTNPKEDKFWRELGMAILYCAGIVGCLVYAFGIIGAAGLIGLTISIVRRCKVN